MALKKQLDTPYDVYAEIVAVKYTNFSFDITSQLVHIGYSILMSGNVSFQEDIPITLSGTEYTDFIARMNALGATLSGSDAQAQAVLEYCPGNGIISGDIKTLNNPYIIDGTVMGYEIDGNAENDIEKLIHIRYSLLDAPSSALQTDITHALTGQEYIDFVARFNDLSLTMTATQAKIQALLENLPSAGTIVDI
jgi:hypothetical protein